VNIFGEIYKRMSKIKLNILKAGSGDSIHLQYTSNEDIQKNILIDGGIENIYQKEIKHILKDILSLDLVIVTHIDRDHIGGINKLLNSPDTAKVKKVYFNSADLITKNDSNFISISDGINLVEYLGNKNINTNEIPIVNGSSFNFEEFVLEFLSPPAESLKYLQNEWETIKKEKENTLVSFSKTFDVRQLNDIVKEKFTEHAYKSDIANWSSLAFILQFKKCIFLFLGDAKDSVIINALREQGYSSKKKYKVDYIKLSHHGSKYNTSKEFLEMIDCRHYIFSTNGTHQKPHIETIARILCNDVRNLNDKIYLYFNYPKEQYISKKVRLLTNEEEQKYNCECIYNKNIFEFEE